MLPCCRMRCPQCAMCRVRKQHKCSVSPPDHCRHTGCWWSSVPSRQGTVDPYIKLQGEQEAAAGPPLVVPASNPCVRRATSGNQTRVSDCIPSSCRRAHQQCLTSSFGEVTNLRSKPVFSLHEHADLEGSPCGSQVSPADRQATPQANPGASSQQPHPCCRHLQGPIGASLLLGLQAGPRVQEQAHLPAHAPLAAGGADDQRISLQDSLQGTPSRVSLSERHWA